LARGSFPAFFKCKIRNRFDPPERRTFDEKLFHRGGDEVSHLIQPRMARMKAFRSENHP
jgi:hypothetical protein